MNSTNEISSFYSKLFTLGSTKRNLLLYTILVLIPICLGLVYHLSFLYLAITFLFILLAEYVLFKSLLVESYKLFNIRRILAANWMVLTFSYLPLPLLLLNIKLTYIIALTLMIFLSWKTIIYTVLTFEGYKYGFLAVLLNYLLFLPFLVIARVPLIAYILPICIIASFIYIYLLDKITRVNRYGGIAYFRGYIASWAADEPKYMEYLLTENSTPTNVDIHIFDFKSDHDQLKLIVPYFHFGPFKDVGSSAFPGYLINNAVSRGIDLVVLHATVTHDLDLASINDVNKVAEVVFSESEGYQINGISKLVEMELNDARVSGFKIGNIPTLILSYKEIEDLPLQVYDKLKVIAEKYGFKDIIVVDAHNSLTKPHIEMSDEAINQLCQVAEKVIAKLSTEPLFQIILSHQIFNIEGFELIDGLGSGGVAVIMWKTGNNYNVIVVFDSNNMNPNYRDKLSEQIKKVLGNANIAILTTDTHEVTARALIKDGYVIWGSNKKSFQSIPIIINKVLETRSKLRKYTVKYRKETVKVNVLGEDIVNKARKLIKKSFHYAKVLSVIPISSIIISILILILWV